MNRLLIAALLVLACAAPAQAALKVFACEPEWGALTRELGGAEVEVYDATHALQDVHKIQPRPSLIAKFRQARLAVCTGAELEVGWLPVLQQTAGNPALLSGKPGMFEAYQYVEMLEVPRTLDRSAGDVHAYGNPHIQTSPLCIAKVAPALTERLAQLDPANAKAYRQRYAAFKQRWDAAIARWTAQGSALRGVKVISHHRSWTYLYAWLGIEEVATLEPKPGVPPSAAHLQALLAAQKSSPARAVIHAAYQDPQAARFFSERSGIPSIELPYTVGGSVDAPDLFGLFDVTLQRLLGTARQ